mmetsp:Transcript_22138/g.51076  ORF Transcript_22138/g.51076 Transcript_22138/m.51076 type:complete len:304 (+) Transcript_22138:528-1439(+)
MVDHAPGQVVADFASFVNKVRKDPDRAEALYRRALAVEPTQPQALGNYARFLANVRGDLHRAEGLYEQALANGPNHVHNLVNFAQLLKQVERYDDAQELLKRATVADPESPIALNNYANFMWKVRDNVVAARDIYVRGLKANPKDPLLGRNYAIFLSRNKAFWSGPSKVGGGDGQRFGKKRKGKKSRSGSPGGMMSPAGRRPRPPKGPVIGPDGEPIRPAEPPRGGGGARDDLSVLEEASDPLDEMGTVEAGAMRRAMGEEGGMMASTHSLGSMTSTIATKEEVDEDEGEMPHALGDTGVMLK